MYYCKQENTEGCYIGPENKRYVLYESESVLCPHGQTPEENGWYSFPTREACLEAWGLVYDPPSSLQASVSAEATPRQDGVASPSTPRQDAETSPLPVPKVEN